MRALSLFQEYLGNAAATEASFTTDGWFRTGDRVDIVERAETRIVFLIEKTAGAVA